MDTGIICQETLKSEVAGNELVHERRNHPAVHDAHLSQHCFLAILLQQAVPAAGTVIRTELRSMLYALKL